MQGEENVSPVKPTQVSSNSSSDSLLDSQAAEPEPVIPKVNDPIPAEQNVLPDVVGQNELNATDSAVLNGDQGLSHSISTDEEAESYSESLTADTVSPNQTAGSGNWQDNATTFGTNEYVNDILANLNSDDRIAFWENFTRYSLDGAEVPHINIPQSPLLPFK